MEMMREGTESEFLVDWRLLGREEQAGDWDEGKWDLTVDLAKEQGKVVGWHQGKEKFET